MEDVVDEETLAKSIISIMDYCFEAKLFDEGFSFMRAINSISD